MPDKPFSDGRPFQHPSAYFQQENLTLVVDSLAEGCMIIDPEGIICQINQAAQNLYLGGTIPNRGEALADCCPNDWVEVKKVLASGIPQLYTLLHLPRATVVTSRVPIKHEGRIAGVATLMQDIANFNAFLDELTEFRNTSNEMQTIIDQFEEVLITLNRHGIICNANAAYEKLISLGRQGIIGRHIEDIHRSPKELAALFHEALRSRTKVVQKVSLHKNRLTEASALPSYDASGQLFRVFVRLQEPEPPEELPSSPSETTRSAEMASPLSVEVRRLCDASGFMVHSAAMNFVVQQALRVSKTPSCVLITGESGVGKTMLASLIHNNSNRCRRPFVVINCGSIPEHLLESELFGYEKGAFTGANTQGKRGLIETADTGTLFLDEIGELQYSLQSKLLEVLEKKSFIRVGGTKRTSVDIRIIAATNKDLAKEMEKGRFRRDLFYRLNVIPISIPPLRERPDDIRAMIDLVVGRYNEQNNTQKRMAPALLRWLLSYPFLGNMRELVNIMEWLLVMSEQDVLTLADLPTRLKPDCVTKKEEPLPLGTVDLAPPVTAVPLPREDMIEQALARDLSLKEATELFEKDYLERAMKRHGSIKRVSQALNVHFSTLWRKLVKYGILQNHAASEDNHD